MGQAPFHMAHKSLNRPPGQSTRDSSRTCSSRGSTTHAANTKCVTGSAQQIPDPVTARPFHRLRRSWPPRRFVSSTNSRSTLWWSTSTIVSRARHKRASLASLLRTGTSCGCCSLRRPLQKWGTSRTQRTATHTNAHHTTPNNTTHNSTYDALRPILQRALRNTKQHHAQFDVQCLAPDTPHSTPHTPHPTRHAPHSTLHAPRTTLRTPHSTLTPDARRS
jgi:hypothetical protein